jgi:hypothetical protein
MATEFFNASGGERSRAPVETMHATSYCQLHPVTTFDIGQCGG